MHRFWCAFILGLSLLLNGAMVQAENEWKIPFWGKASLADNVYVEKGQPQTLEGALPHRLTEYGFRNPIYFVLVKQDDSDFAYAYAGLVKQDAAFIMTIKEPVRDIVPPIRRPAPIPIPRDPTIVPMSDTKEQTAPATKTVAKPETSRVHYRTVKRIVKPKKAEERLAVAAKYWDEKLRSNWVVQQPFQGFTKQKWKKETIYTAEWKEFKRRQDISFTQSVRAWLFDDGFNTYLFFIVSDGRQEKWLDELGKEVAKGRKK